MLECFLSLLASENVSTIIWVPLVSQAGKLALN